MKKSIVRDIREGYCSEVLDFYRCQLDTHFGFASPSTRDVAMDDPGCVIKKRSAASFRGVISHLIGASSGVGSGKKKKKERDKRKYQNMNSASSYLKKNKHTRARVPR